MIEVSTLVDASMQCNSCYSRDGTLPAKLDQVVTMGLAGIALSAGCFAALIAAGVLFEHRVRSRLARHMSSRVPLSDEAFGAAYFPASWTKAASRIRRIVGQHLDIDMSRALPSDRFVDDLRMDELDSMASVMIVMQIEEEFGITIADDEAKSIATIEQLVNCVGYKLDSKPCLLDQELGA